MPETKKNYIELILNKMKEPTFRAMRRSELAKEFKLHESERPALRAALKKLVRRGDIVILRKNRYALPHEQQTVTGKISVHAKGFGFVSVLSDASLPDIFIPKNGINTARSRDRVRISYATSSKPTRAGEKVSYEGEVLEVVERAYTSLAGILFGEPGLQYVEILDSRFPEHIHVKSIKDGLTPVAGNVVVISVEESDSTKKEKSFYGRILEDWGSCEQANMDISMLMKNYDLPMEFSDELLAEANKMTLPQGQALLEGRKDLRDKFIFTIDPFDARDFDDAIHMEMTKEGTIELGIHIADVAYFVPEGGAIDEEAIERGNSTYLVDRVVPMLPEHLTNDLCSLVPHQDRLVHTVILTLNSDGKWLDYETHRSVIHSKARLTYAEAQEIIDGESSTHPKDVQLKVREIFKLTEMLRKKRIKAGALDFSMPERKIILDELGKVNEVRLSQPLQACQMIEECMLVANQIVARILSEKMEHAIYRVHEEPSEEQWEKMGKDLEAFHLPFIPECNHDLNKLIQRLEEGPNKLLATITILKNLKRARYSEERLEHFGLSFSHYSHFTSPIRRYPDLIAHRMLCSLEQGGKPKIDLKQLQYWAQHCSQTERDSDEAEKASKDLKMLAYYNDLLSEGEIGPYPMVVTGVNNFGLILEFKDTGQRGDIPFTNLSNEYVEIDEQHQTARASRSGQLWKPGTELTCTMVSVNIRERRIELDTERKGGKSGGKKSKRNKSYAKGKENSSNKRKNKSSKKASSSSSKKKANSKKSRKAK